jgi:hypothetical protein
MAGPPRWTDWVAATAFAAGGAALIVLAAWLWQQDRVLQRQGVRVAAELVGLREEPEGRAIVELRFASATGPVTVRRLVGKEARAGWRVGDRLPLIYLPGAAYEADLANHRDRGFLWGGLGLAVLAAAAWWMRRLRRAGLVVADSVPAAVPAPRLPAPVRAPIVPEAEVDMLRVARRLVAMESADKANAWLARGEFALGVDFGDGGVDIVDAWNRRLGKGAPLRHEYVPEEEREDGSDEDPIFGWLEFRGRRVPYRVRGERVTDALLIVHALAQVLQPDLELRFCRDSRGSTVPDFVPLRPSAWASVVVQFGVEAVERRFAAIPMDFDAFERLIMGEAPNWAR